MSPTEDRMSVVEELISEFNDELAAGCVPSFDRYLERCPEADRTELLSLLNTLVLADRALAPMRELLRDSPRTERDPAGTDAAALETANADRG